MSSKKLKGMSCTMLLLLVCAIVPQGSHGRTDPSFKLKAVSLGGWLVTEGWILPSLFDGIPNNDLLDGTRIQLKSVTMGKFVSAELGGGSVMVANRTIASTWETFNLRRIDEHTFNLRVFFYQFIGLRSGEGVPNRVVAVATNPTNSEAFQIIRNSVNRNRIKIRASNGLFIQAKTEHILTADYSGVGGWGNKNPSVFEMTIVSSLHGEYQITNGYGPLRASQVMRDHWNSYIVEEDFKFMSQNGINGVRIPVGWWIASDPNPPKPFVGGSLNSLDNAFSWASTYNIKVIIDLHAAPGSQNGNEHSGSRDGSQEWGKTDANIQQTVDVIDFLAARYATHPSLYAVELINEPLAPGVSLDSLKKYYQMGYDVVRKHTQSAYVILSNRLGPINSKELFSLASGMQNVVIDVHYYNLFSDYFNKLTPKQHIDFVYNTRASQLAQITTSDGPLTFVGEWVANWKAQGASKEDYQRFANAQLQVYGKASFGWAYWTFKNVNNYWSLQWMISNGYITL